MAVVCDLLGSESLLDIVLNKANISELIETAFWLSEVVALRNSPRQYAGRTCPLCGLASPFSEWPLRVRGPCGRTCNRAALGGGVTYRTRNRSDKTPTPVAPTPVLFGSGSSGVDSSVWGGYCRDLPRCLVVEAVS